MKKKPTRQTKPGQKNDPAARPLTPPPLKATRKEEESQAATPAVQAEGRISSKAAPKSGKAAAKSEPVSPPPAGKPPGGRVATKPAAAEVKLTATPKQPVQTAARKKPSRKPESAPKGPSVPPLAAPETPKSQAPAGIPKKASVKAPVKKETGERTSSLKAAVPPPALSPDPGSASKAATAQTKTESKPKPGGEPRDITGAQLKTGKPGKETPTTAVQTAKKEPASKPASAPARRTLKQAAKPSKKVTASTVPQAPSPAKPAPVAQGKPTKAPAAEKPVSDPAGKASAAPRMKAAKTAEPVAPARPTAAKLVEPAGATSTGASTPAATRSRKTAVASVLLPPKAPAARRLAARAARTRKAARELETEKKASVTETTSSTEAPATVSLTVKSTAEILSPPAAESGSGKPAEPRAFKAPIEKSSSARSAVSGIPAYLLEGDDPTPLPPEYRRRPEPIPAAPTQPAAAPVPMPPMSQAGAGTELQKPVTPTPAPPPLAPRPAPAPPIEPPAPRRFVELVLTARDPHCLYALWELDTETQGTAVRDSVDGRLVLRVYQDHFGTSPVTEIYLLPEQRHCFCQVGQGGTRYFGELGYYGRPRFWQVVGRSGEAVTPPDAPSRPAPVEFAAFQPAPEPRNGGSRSEPAPVAPAWVPPATAPAEPTPPANFSAPGTDAPESWAASMPAAPAPSLWAVSPSRALVAAGLRRATYVTSRSRTVEEVLESVMPVAVPADSEVLLQSVKRRSEQEGVEIGQEIPGITEVLAPAPVSSLAVALPVSQPGVEQALEVTSPAPLPPAAVPGRDFWFKVNAELVIYGSTESTATVTIGGRPIRLRPDGTFSFRFALPDGRYELPVVARATHGDQREAALEFSRKTDLRGDVGKHPQDPALRPPTVENVS